MIRPLLAQSIDTEEQLAEVLRMHGSLCVSEKEDGIRTIVSSGLRSREDKLIPNRHLQSFFRMIPEGIEGELMFKIDGMDVHPPLEQINSIVTSRDLLWPKRWTPVLKAFDLQPKPGQVTNKSFRQRYKQIKDIRRVLDKSPMYVGRMEVIPHHEMDNVTEIMEYFRFIIERGGEGICLRNPEAYYKQGRATLRGGELMRFKKLMQGRAKVLTWEPLKRHIGEQKPNSFGLAKRDSRLTNLLTDYTTLGALVCRHSTLGEFKVGSGFTEAQRKSYAKYPPAYIIFEYRDVTHKGVPRNPTFVEPA